MTNRESFVKGEKYLEIQGGLPPSYSSAVDFLQHSLSHKYPKVLATSNEFYQCRLFPRTGKNQGNTFDASSTVSRPSEQPNTFSEKISHQNYQRS